MQRRYDPTIMQTIDTILPSCRPRPCWPGHGETTRGLFSRNDSPLVRSVLCSALNLTIYLSTPYSFIHVHTFSRPMKYSLLYHSCFDTSAVRSPQVWPQNKQNNFQSIHLMLKIFYLHIYTSNHKYYPCSRSLMHAYHLFLPLYK